MKAEALRCDYCGGYVNPKTYRCEYCGTQYVKSKEDPFHPLEIKYVGVPAGCDVYSVETILNRKQVRFMNEMGVPIEEEVRRDFAKKIADLIAQKIEIYEEFDIDANKMKYSARLRVVKPEFRF